MSKELVTVEWFDALKGIGEGFTFQHNTKVFINVYMVDWKPFRDANLFVNFIPKHCYLCKVKDGIYSEITN